MPVYHPANVVLESIVGAVVSSLIELEVTVVVLQFDAASQTFGVTLQVDVAHSMFIVQLTGVHDVIPTASV